MTTKNERERIDETPIENLQELTAEDLKRVTAGFDPVSAFIGAAVVTVGMALGAAAYNEIAGGKSLRQICGY